MCDTAYLLGEDVDPSLNDLGNEVLCKNRRKGWEKLMWKLEIHMFVNKQSQCKTKNNVV